MDTDVVKLLLGTIYDSTGAKEMKNDLKDVRKEVNNTNSLTSKAFDVGKTLLFGKSIQQTAQRLTEAVKASANYIESLNVLDVAFNNNTDDIRAFSNEIAKTLNLDDSTIINASAHFKVLSQSMSMANDTGEKFAKLLTQMTLDVSSLYNLDFNKAQSALQYAVEGRGTTLKQRTGVSVLESTVQQTLDTLGIDAYVEDMNDTEKAIARVIAMTYQLRNSQGDLARTIEAPANQMRILGEQVSMAGRNIGNIFLPMVASVLPYLNALFIVINKVLSAIASLFGFSENAWDFFDGAEEASEGWNDLGSAIGGVGDSAKSTADKLKGLRGFDKLNVINTPTSGGGGGGGAGGGGVGSINPNLLKAFGSIFDNYNNSLAGVRTKATEIAEAFMEWAKVLTPLEKPLKELAGLTYEGLVYVWKNVLLPLGKWVADDLIPAGVKALASALELVYQVGQKVFGIYKSVYEVVIRPFASVLGKAIVNTLNDISKVLDFISKSKILTTLLAWVVAFKQLNTVLGLIAKTNIGKSLTSAIGLIFEQENGVLSLSKSWKNFLTLVSPKNLKSITNEMTTQQKAVVRLQNGMSRLKTFAQGAVTALAGFELLRGSFDDISKKGMTIGNVLGTIAGAIITITGLITSLNAVLGIFGITMSAIPIVGWISAIAGAGVAIGTLIAGMNKFNSSSSASNVALGELNKAYDDYKNKIDEVNNSYSSMLNNFNQSYEAKLLEIENGKEYINSLDEIVDGNYRVKAGYEDVANTILNELNNAYGLELTQEDGIIKNNGTIISGKQQLISITDEYIEGIKKQTLYEGYQAMYKQAIEDQTKATIARDKAQQEINRTIEETNKKLQNQQITAKEAEKIFEESKNKTDKIEKKYQDTLGVTKNIIEGLGDVTNAYANKSSTELEQVIVGVSSGSKKSSEDIKKNYSTSLSELEKAIKDVKNKNNLAISDMKKNSTITWKIKVDKSQAVRDYNSLVDQMYSSSANSQIKITPPSKIQGYAEGGLPKQGQLFYANENGAELVGQVGGQTFVANQNQMLDIIDKKLSSAGGGVQNATFNIQVGDEEVARVVLHNLTEMAKSSGKPIKIGG